MFTTPNYGSTFTDVSRYIVFFGCCIVGAAFTLLLPEVKGRDPDAILAAEIEEEGQNGGLSK